jgi:quercetin dioxygenase-like cupin family protein
MKTKRIPQLIIALAVLGACSDTQDPTAAPQQRSHGDHMSNATSPSLAITAATATPFTVRATLQPYLINQQPQFMLQSKVASDIVMQQSVFAPGPSIWHTHPGPSFVYVLDGNIKVEKALKHGECDESPVRGPGDAYVEPGDLVHRAVVTSATPAVVLVTRFNVPVGQPFTIPAADPGC